MNYGDNLGLSSYDVNNYGLSSYDGNYLVSNKKAAERMDCKSEENDDFRVDESKDFKESDETSQLTCSSNKENQAPDYKRYFENAKKEIGCKLSDEEMLSIDLYIQEKKEGLFNLARTLKNNYYIKPAGSRVRAIQFNLDGTIFIHLNKGDKTYTVKGEKVVEPGDLCLGQGAYKKTKCAVEYDTGKLYASSSIGKNDANEELEQGKLVKGIKGVIQISSSVFYRSRGKEKARILTPLYNLGSLQSVAPALNAGQKKIVFLQSAKGLINLHEKGLLHRDIKLANIFINQSQDGSIETCLGDLGSLCRSDDKTRLSEYRTTSTYVSPQYAKLWLQQSKEKTFDLSSVTSPELDLWSFGTVFYKIFEGRQVPWFAPTDEATFVNLAKLDKVMDEPKDNKSMEHIVYRLLQVDPQKRMTAKEFKEAVEVIS